ncbi:MAG: Verru_Chthon cassette protein B [Verrucomicrobiales bacterium]|nr:Verru_Chthon cassette protein B [Verrucomicrobiales bacterium]
MAVMYPSMTMRVMQLCRFDGSGHRRRAFSLVEVTLALGIATFALLTIVSILPLGLRMVRDSAIDQATANITSQIRGELQQLSAASFSGTSYFYTNDGLAAEDAADYYFEAQLEEVSATDMEFAGADFSQRSARLIRVELSYPYAAPRAARKSAVFSLLAARQTGVEDSR